MASVLSPKSRLHYRAAYRWERMWQLRFSCGSGSAVINESRNPYLELCWTKLSKRASWHGTSQSILYGVQDTVNSITNSNAVMGKKIMTAAPCQSSAMTIKLIVASCATPQKGDANPTRGQPTPNAALLVVWLHASGWGVSWVVGLRQPKLRLVTYSKDCRLLNVISGRKSGRRGLIQRFCR